MNIVYAITGRYYKELAISILSILKNTKSKDINFFVLVDEKNKNLKNHEVFIKLFNFVNIIEVDDTRFNSYPCIERFSKAAYYKFLITEKIPNIDKCIYLDLDTIIELDISELWNIDVTNHVCAAVLDRNIKLNPNWISKLFPSADNYINSGILLINLKYWKTILNNLKGFIPEYNNKISFFVLKYNNKISFADQDFINYFMNDKILIISDKYNYQQLMNGKDDNLIQERIIHYCGIRPLEERANPEFTKAFKYYESELKNILNYNVIQYNINSNNYLFHYRKIDTENLNDMKYPFVKTTNNKKTIIDIGGNIGSSVIHFKKMYPDSTIYVFEPDPDCYEVLIKNTEQHDNIHCYNIGLFNENKIEKLNRNRFGSSGNSIYLKDGITSNSIDVTLRKTSEIFNELKLFNSNILKIDTEGCEIPILKDILLLNIDFELIYIEYHCDEDRFEIEKLLYPKYRLINVNIMYKNIGELTYVNDNIERVDYNGLLLPNQKS